MSTKEGPTNLNDREIVKCDQTDSVVTTTVKTDNINDARNITGDPLTSYTTYASNTTQRSTIQPNWIQTPTLVAITQPNLNWLNTITSSSAYLITNYFYFTTIYYYTF